MTAPRWEHFEHDADIGVRGRGAGPAQAFERAATALTAIICDPGQVQPIDTVTVTCRAPDLELLLVDWLNAVIYEMATRSMLFGHFEVHIDNNVLNATLLGEPVDRARHQPAVEPKGATYTGLRVARQPEGDWMAQCVIDV